MVCLRLDRFAPMLSEWGGRGFWDFFVYFRLRLWAVWFAVSGVVLV